MPLDLCYIQHAEMSAGYQSDEPVQAESRRRVMSAVMERWNLMVFPRCKAFLEECTSSWVQCSNWLQAQTTSPTYNHIHIM